MGKKELSDKHFQRICEILKPKLTFEEFDEIEGHICHIENLMRDITYQKALKEKIEFDEKDFYLIKWALITYKNDGKCSQDVFERTYNKLKEVQ